MAVVSDTGGYPTRCKVKVKNRSCPREYIARATSMLHTRTNIGSQSIMISRALAFSFLTAIGVAGLALSTSSASAQTQVVCNADAYGRPYNCHHIGYAAHYHQSPCGACGSRGLFTSTWVQPTPCGTCQRAIIVPRPAPCG